MKHSAAGSSVQLNLYPQGIGRRREALEFTASEGEICR